MVFATTDKAKKHRGISAFIVPKPTEGECVRLSVLREEEVEEEALLKVSTCLNLSYKRDSLGSHGGSDEGKGR